MTRFAGKVGYGERVEYPAPGSGDFRDVVIEHKRSGRIIRNSRRIQAEGKVNFDLVVQNSIEIVASAYDRENMDKLRYVLWRNNRWLVDEITEAYPRLILHLGGLYTGDIPVPEVVVSP